MVVAPHTGGDNLFVLNDTWCHGLLFFSFDFVVLGKKLNYEIGTTSSMSAKFGFDREIRI